MELEVGCVEVSAGETVIGYAIFFSGGWDAYIVDAQSSLWKVGTNYRTRNEAVKAIRKG